MDREIRLDWFSHSTNYFHLLRSSWYADLLFTNLIGQFVPEQSRSQEMPSASVKPVCLLYVQLCHGL